MEFIVHQYSLEYEGGNLVTLNQEDPAETDGHTIFLTIQQLPLLISQLQKIAAEAEHEVV